MGQGNGRSFLAAQSLGRRLDGKLERAMPSNKAQPGNPGDQRTLVSVEFLE